LSRAKKPRIGRPPLPKGEAKRDVLIVRLAADEKQAIEAAAERAGIRVSEWVRSTLLGAANA
jgi:uncharacterized protein (DUF1778 family)